MRDDPDRGSHVMANDGKYVGVGRSSSQFVVHRFGIKTAFQAPWLIFATPQPGDFDGKDRR